MKTKREEIIPLEEEEQMAVVGYLEALGYLYHASPNGGKRHIVTAMKLKRLGCKPGFPDIMVFEPIMHNGTVTPGIAIEMKRLKGGKVEPEQAQWIAKLSSRGWYAKVCCGAEEAIQFIGDSYGLRRGKQ